MSKTHDIKTVNPFFTDVWEGRKTFELRNNDRNFNVGDTVILSEWDVDRWTYANRKIVCNITYILKGYKGVEEGYCIFQFEIFHKSQL